MILPLPASRYGADSQAYGMAVGMFNQPSCEAAVARALEQVQLIVVCITCRGQGAGAGALAVDCGVHQMSRMPDSFVESLVAGSQQWHGKLENDPNYVHG